MPLKTGSDQATINDNISCILKGYKTPHAEGGTGCGYDPPYKDPARKKYTPAQAAAIAYAKAGKRNNTGGGGDGGKKAKKEKPAEKPKTESKPPESPPKKKNEPIKAKKAPAPAPAPAPQVPDGWKVQQPGGDITSKKNQPLEAPSKKEATPSSQGLAYEPISKPDGWRVKDQQNNPPSSSSKQTFKVSDQFGFKIPEGRPNFDIKQAFDNGDVTGQEGSFGEVRFNPDKTEVYKQGEIGQNEALAIKKLEKTGVVPEFLGAVIDEKGAIVDDGFGAHVKAAKGYLGMGMAPGRPTGAYIWGANKLSPQEKTQMLEEYYRIRMVIHSNGVAHNDMHSNNFFYDRDTGKGICIDFGLAQLSYRAALVEALGTFNGRDWQADGMNDSLIGAPKIKKLQKNVRSVHEKIKSKYGTTVRHEIRSSDEDLDDLPFDEQEAKRYIKMIYQGVFS